MSTSSNYPRLSIYDNMVLSDLLDDDDIRETLEANGHVELKLPSGRVFRVSRKAMEEIS